jgi:hypothetical protein
MRILRVVGTPRCTSGHVNVGCTLDVNPVFVLKRAVRHSVTGSAHDGY